MRPGTWWTDKREMYARKNVSLAQQMARRRYRIKKRKEKLALKKNQAVESALDHAEHYAIDVYDRLVSMRENIDYGGIWSVKETLRTLTESIKKLEEICNTMRTTPLK